MTTPIFERFPVIDMDTHLTEPPDVWTERVSSKWGDRIPHVERVGPKDVWRIGEKVVGARPMKKRYLTLMLPFWTFSRITSRETRWMPLSAGQT